jgi:hypothetical protein
MKRRNGIELLPLYKKKLASSCRRGRNHLKGGRREEGKQKGKRLCPTDPTSQRMKRAKEQEI